MGGATDKADVGRRNNSEGVLDVGQVDPNASTLRSKTNKSGADPSQAGIIIAAFTEVRVSEDVLNTAASGGRNAAGGRIREK